MQSKGVLPFLLAFALSAFSNLTWGQQTTVPFGTSWERLIVKLKAQGVFQVGDLNLEKVLDDGRKITWREKQPGEQIPNMAEGRQSAYFDPVHKVVTMSPSLHTYDRTGLTLLEMHEVLNALGYNDRTYNLSTALNMMAQVPAAMNSDQLRVEYGNSLFNKSVLNTPKAALNSGSKARGGSSVGGGGDVWAQTIKNQVILELLNSKQPLSLEFLKDYPYLNFEPFYDPQQQFVALRYQFRSQKFISLGDVLLGVRIDPIHGYQELITVYVPVIKWRQGAKAQREIIEELKTRVLSLYPAAPNVPQVGYEPLCAVGKGPAVNFPVTDVVAIIAIQQARAAVIDGCTESPMIITDMRSPAFQDYLEQKGVDDLTGRTAGPDSPQYDCRILGDQIDFSFQLHTVAGVPYSTGQMIAIPGIHKRGISLLLAAGFWNANGKLTALALQNSGRRDGDFNMSNFRDIDSRVSNATELDNTSQGTVTLKLLSGSNANMTCQAQR